MFGMILIAAGAAWLVRQIAILIIESRAASYAAEALSK